MPSNQMAFDPRKKEGGKNLETCSQVHDLFRVKLIPICMTNTY